MNRRDVLERVLQLRRARLDLCRAAWARADAEKDGATRAASTAQAALDDAGATRRGLRQPGRVDVVELLALERSIRALRTRLQAARTVLDTAAAREDSARVRLEMAGRSTWGGERALSRLRREELRQQARRERIELQERFGVSGRHVA